MVQKESRLLNVRKAVSSQKGKQRTNHASPADFLAGGGEMGERIRATDWSKTPLGAVEGWPQSLKTIVRIMLTSRQPIWIGWGPDLIKLYNDPYKAIVGGKHPEALGQPASVVWREIWDDIGPRLQTAMQQNEGTYDESLLLLMERYGYQEETYYTFSYSPVPGDRGGVEGIICANTDDTQRIIGERQLKLLRTLAAETTDARTIEAACRLSATSLEQNPYDIPFAMLYLFDHEKQRAYLAGTSGIQKGHPAVPEVVALDAHALWPFHEVIRTGKARVISQPGDLFDDLPAGAWKNQPHQAVILPIAPSGHTGKAGMLLAALNPFRLYDEEYQGFLNLVAGQIAASIANAQAYEEERERAEALAEIDRAKKADLRNVEESEARFRTLADNISQFAWMADANGWIFWYNQRWYDYTGTNLQDMQGWGWQKVHHPDHVERVVEKIRYCFETGEGWEDTFPLRGRDGTYRWFLSRAIPIRDEQGKIIRWFGTNTDITEQKQLEQQKDDFIGIASHELKTPVTSLKAYAQLLERRFRQGGDVRSAELLQKMDAQVDKLTSLIGDLLDVTKIESGQLLFQHSSFDFNELINEIVEETQRTTTRHTIRQEIAAPITLSADRDRIGQVLTNLLTNAIKYSPQAQTVVVKTVRTGDAIITSVQDFGIGIPGEKQPRIFERFFRVGGETQITYPGLGLGLYISAEFVKRHGGSIWVESEQGKGTTFSFSLPL